MKRILTFLFLFSSLFASSQTQFLGAPNTTIVVKGNMKVDSILYLPKRSKTPTDTGALRYQISDSSLYVWTGNAWRKAKNDGTVTSVGLTMPSAFAVANSPVTTSGTLAVTATGSATEYIRGDGTLGTLPTSGGGGGSGVNYYLNGSVSQGTIGGSTYYEMSKTPVVGTGTNFTAAADGLIQQFITDAGDPNRLLIPAGAWNFELYFSASSTGGTPTFYVELLKYDGTTFTSISSSSASPQAISNGTTKTLYFTSLAVSETVLTATDRLAIRVYVAVSGRTITFYTEDANLAEIITTFAGGVVSLNGLTANDQFFATGTTGTNFNIASTSATHTFNLPTASATNRGALSSTDWSTFNNKVNISDTAAMLTNYIRHGGYGLTKTGQALSVDTSAIATRSRVQKGIDSVASVRVGGSGITGYIPKWTALRTQDTSQLFQSAGFVGIGTTSPSYKLDVNGEGRFQGTLYTRAGTNVGIQMTATSTIRNAGQQYFDFGTGGTGNFEFRAGSGFTTALTMFNNARIGVNTTTDAGYQLDIAGTLRNTTGANFATSSGNVGIGTTSASEKLHVTGRIRATTIDSTGTGTAMNILYADATGVIKKAAVPSGGGGSVTSITASTGLTGGTITTSGTIAVDTASIATRARVQKGIDSVTTLANTKVSGTGISGYFPKWTGASTQDTSQLFQLGRNIGIGTASPTYRIHLPDAGNVNAQAMIAGTVLGSDGNGQTIRPSGSLAMALFGQADIGYIYGAAVSSTGRWGINTRSLNDATFNVDGSVKIVTIDSTSTARNMLYQDANGVIKKSAVPSGLTMADDVMTASGSWVATKDAGSGVTINNIAYTTNGTTKMVTVDGNFYIPEASWTDATWVTISTIPSGYRPSKTINWNSSYIISGAEYERADNTDFTGACDIQGQMRIKDDGTVQVNATMNTNSIAAGGTAYIIVQFTQSYIIK